MNDDTLIAALERMASSLEPPAAADDLIDARRSQLRRRRRVTTGLAAASVFAIIATGGVLASSFGNASPAPDNVPVASDGPAPSEVAEDADRHRARDPRERQPLALQSGPDDARGAPGVQERSHRRGTADLDLVDDKVHAYVVLGDKSDGVYELEARRLANDEVDIVSVRKCAG